MHRTFLFTFLLTLALLAGACSQASGDAAVAARIGRHDISVAELDAWIKERLFERETGASVDKLHEVRRRELDNFIAEELLTREAKTRGVPVAELLESELGRRAATVGESALREFYQKNREHMRGASFDEMRTRIREFLEQDAQQNARLAFVEELRARENVQVLIETPRVQIAGTGPARGPADAPVTLVEFSDYECPFCQRAEATVAALLAAYPDALRFEYRHFPLESIHPRAHAAARAAHCADEQDNFWGYHERLFTDGADLERAGLEESARKLNLELKDFRACLDAPRSEARVDEDLREGERLGVQSTPTFFINGIRMEGARDIAAFRKLIERELEAARAGAS